MNCINDAPMTMFELDSMYPAIPAEDDTSAIMLSSVLFPTVIHLTSAKDVKEKTNVIQAAAIIGGINRGSHKFLMRESLVRPWGRSRNCSSSSGFIEDNSGSQNLINNAMLNHA